MKSVRKNIQNLLKSYVHDRNGASALEFSILALPFIALVFAIIEVAIVFLLGSSLTNAVHKTSRDIRTGEFQATCGTAVQFKENICREMSSSSECMNRLRIDVVSSPSGRFSPNLLPPTPTTPDPDDPGRPVINPDTYVNTDAGEVVVVRAQYYLPLTAPGRLTRLANQPGNTRVITSSTAFRNEPFPQGC